MPYDPEKNRARHASYRAKNPEKRRLSKAKWDEANREKTRAYSRNYQKEHKSERRTYRLAHPEQDKMTSKRYRAAHSEKVKIWRANASTQSLVYRTVNHDKLREYQKTWRRNHPNQHHAQIYRRRALRMNAAINDFTASQWIEMQAIYDHRCAYCGKRAKGHLTQDHITPLSKGGNHTRSNIIPACQSCNSKKRTGPPLKPVQPLLL